MIKHYSSGQKPSFLTLRPPCPPLWCNTCHTACCRLKKCLCFTPELSESPGRASDTNIMRTCLSQHCSAAALVTNRLLMCTNVLKMSHKNDRPHHRALWFGSLAVVPCVGRMLAVSPPQTSCWASDRWHKSISGKSVGSVARAREQRRNSQPQGGCKIQRKVWERRRRGQTQTAG